ncbi:hypothetical protein DZD18_16945 [Rhodobacteraceae bacterium W635]|nr:hypothetical protein DZD18_16945 [Rhodobacteraceae bacterium W635]
MEVGQWHDDGWISPYLRIRFEAPSDNPRLAVSVYNPDDGTQERRLAIRQGPRTLLTDDPLPMQDVARFSVTLAARRGTEVEVSLRTDRPFDHGGGDERRLGVVMTACRLLSVSETNGED